MGRGEGGGLYWELGNDSWMVRREEGRLTAGETWERSTGLGRGRMSRLPWRVGESRVE